LSFQLSCQPLFQVGIAVPAVLAVLIGGPARHRRDRRDNDLRHGIRLNPDFSSGAVNISVVLFLGVERRRMLGR
jgi:hypothetical protein